ncbi:hypothetical protein Bca4012_086253 [Brassica carinata]
MSFSLVYLVLQVYHHMVLIFHSFKGRFINFRYVFFLPDDFQEFFQTTSRKSSDGVFSHVSLS